MKTLAVNFKNWYAIVNTCRKTTAYLIPIGNFKGGYFWYVPLQASPKCSKPSELNKLIIFRAYSKEKRLCPVACIKEYLRIRAGLVDGKPTQFSKRVANYTTQQVVV